MGRKIEIHPPERLKDGHELDAFDCGDHSMNHWIKKVARRADNRTAAVFVVGAGSRVIAYYATAMGAIPLVSAGQLGKDAPNPVPVMILARLGVDVEHQGKGLGADLVANFFKRALRAAKQAGMRAVVVHTLTPELKSFYAKLGFQELEPSGSTMFVAIETLQAAL